MTLSYKDAGVDLDAGDAFVKSIRPRAISTLRPEVIAHLGGFAGCFALPSGYKEPVIVSSTDGVGTKVLLAHTNKYLEHIGQDLVAMVVNDLICTGATPLFFLDYYATSRLNDRQTDWLFEGIANALIACNMTLLGGETAELPGMYKPGDFDVAGFGVGVVERSEIINGHNSVAMGDVLIGIESSGPHSNGYSLIRKVLELRAHDTETEEFSSIVDQVMQPTHLYSPAIEKLKTIVSIKAIANITGGGLIENLPRVVDAHLRCVIDPASWETPSVFWWLMSNGNIHMEEMYRVFNMGIGMVVVVNANDVDATINTIKSFNLRAWKIGEVLPRDGSHSVIIT